MNTPPESSLLAAYPVVGRIAVAWGDMDALGHVNNVVYFRYFEIARIAYLERLGMVESLDSAGIAAILASTHCRYQASLIYPDDLAVGARVTELGADRLTMEYAVASARLGRIAAAGGAVVVAFDYRRGCKIELPQELRERIEALERR